MSAYEHLYLNVNEHKELVATRRPIQLSAVALLWLQEFRMHIKPTTRCNMKFTSKFVVTARCLIT